MPKYKVVGAFCTIDPVKRGKVIGEMIMLQPFRDIEKVCEELEKIRINAQASSIVFRQTGENYTADRFVKLESNVARALTLLRES